ncbi:MAG: hypothetical protein JSS93_09265 [Bacteroidetes bacterium]|nr:hypothetical protein [Bacteroidota bacterium]
MGFRLIVCVLWLLPQYISAQTKTIDSLKAKLFRSKGEEKLILFNKLAYELIGRDGEAADQFADKAILLGKNTNNEKLTGIAYSQKGVNAYLSGYYQKSILNLKKGLVLSVNAKDLTNQGYTLLQLGNCYMDKGILDSSKFYYNKAYLILKDSANPLNLSKLYRNLSVLYRLSGNVKLQKKYIDRALKINYALQNKERIADVLILRAVLLAQQLMYDSAEIVLTMAERKAIEIENSKSWIYTIHYNRVLIAIAQGKYQEAFLYIDSARKYLDENNMPKLKTVFLKNVGRAFNIQGDYELSMQNLYEALTLAEPKNFTNDIIEILCELSWVTIHAGDPQKSLLYAEKALKLATQTNHPIYLVQALNVKGVALKDMNRFAEGKKVLLASADTCSKYHDNIGLVEAYLSIGELSMKAQNFESAVPYISRAINISQESIYNHGELWGHLFMARARIGLKQFSAVFEELMLGERISQYLPEIEAIIEVYNLKKAWYKTQGNFEQSLHYGEMAWRLADSIRSSKVITRFANLQRLDEIQQREKNIQLLTQQNELSEAQVKLKNSKLQIQYILVTVAVLGIIGLLFATFRFRGFYKKIVVLNKGIQERNEEIMAQSEELILSNRTIQELNQHLEKKVDENTTSLKKTNEELIRSNNNLQQFSYVVSHNLRGPIARLLGLTAILKSLPPGEEQNKFVDLTHRSSTDLDQIVTDLSKIINLKGSINSFESVNLKAEFDMAMQQNAIPEEYKNCVSADFVGLTSLHSVKAFIQSIFYNLLNNAYKYRSPDRLLKISVSVKKVNSQAEISVSDNGLGIDLTRHRDAMFKLFKRFHLNADGRGLGLYLVKEQVEALGGTIDVQSQPDVGTTFFIRHPL